MGFFVFKVSLSRFRNIFCFEGEVGIEFRVRLRWLVICLEVSGWLAVGSSVIVEGLFREVGGSVIVGFGFRGFIFRFSFYAEGLCGDGRGLGLLGFILWRRSRFREVF